MRIGLARLVAFAACLLMATAASAQTYPTRQIRLVVPFAAGGPADLLARVIADEMSKDFGQQVFVDNRPGANTIIGAELVAKADPDGYTLLMARSASVLRSNACVRSAVATARLAVARRRASISIHCDQSYFM